MPLALVVLYYYHCIIFTISQRISEFISLEILMKFLRNESIFIGGNWGTIWKVLCTPREPRARLHPKEIIIIRGQDLVVGHQCFTTLPLGQQHIE